jgi:exopolysaccharide production protein ExoQ
MNPNVALLGCIIFVTLIFIIDTRNRKPSSRALIIPLLWFTYASSRPISYWFSRGQTVAMQVDNSAGSPLDRNFLMLLMFIGLIILIKRGLDMNKIVKKNPWVFFLFFFMLLSILWSGYIVVCLKRWIRILGDLVIVMVILTDDDPKEAISVVFRRCAFFVFPFSILCIKYFREIGVAHTPDGLQQMWVGLTTHKNLMGVVAMVHTLFLIYSTVIEKNRTTRVINVIYIAMGLYLLNGSPTSRSMTSISVFFVGIIIIIFVFRIKKDIRKVVRTLIISLVSFFVFEFLMNTIFGTSIITAIVEASGRDMTFTGRSDIWVALITISMNNPILGSGFGAFWLKYSNHSAWSMFYWDMHSAHNGYFTVYLNLGLVGLVILFFLLKNTYSKIMELGIKGKVELCFRLMYFVIILIHNLTESTFLIATQLLWILFLLISISIPREEKQKVNRETIRQRNKNRTPGNRSATEYRQSDRLIEVDILNIH